MKRITLLWTILVLLCSSAAAQSINLSGEFDGAKGVVNLSWNMVSAVSKTSYILLRSTDGGIWTEAAKDQIARNYSAKDFYTFNDKFYTLGKNYYRLKIIDVSNNTVALSPVVIVNTTQITNQSANQLSKSDWIIYPNPATDVLTLSYKGTENLQGVVVVQIQDVTGKIVVKFRSASIYKTIQIPVSNLRKGIYVIQVSVLNELVMNQKFIKQ